MIAFQSRRLAEVFGRPLDQLTASDVEAAVAAQAREEEDLDFKEKIYSVEKAELAKREFAKDLVSFSNGQGGVILIGVGEKNGVAVSATPADCSDQTLRNLRSAVAGLIAPMPIFGVDPIPLPGRPNEGFILITIPRSSDAPHAVRWESKDPQPLVYPRRVGTQTIFLSENQIASAYRDRFATAREQIDELAHVEEDGMDRLSNMAGWLCVSLVPNSTADIRLGHTALSIYKAWAQGIRSLVPERGPFEKQPIFSTTRARRLVLGSREILDQEHTKQSYAELYTDGSGFAASPLFQVEANVQDGFKFGARSVSPIVDEDIILSLSGLLTLLADHSVSHGGLVGDAVVRVSVFNGIHYTATGSEVRPKVSLGHQRSVDPWIKVWGGTRPVESFPVAEWTLSLAETLRPSRDHLIALRLLLTELFQSFGLVEVPQIDEIGGLRKLYWNRHLWSHLDAWAKDAGVEFHERDLGL